MSVADDSSNSNQNKTISMGTGNRIYVSTYFESFGHARSRAQPLAWPVTVHSRGNICEANLEIKSNRGWGFTNF